MIPHFQERAAALESLGWTSRDAEWLALVCLHSGVFLRAQYLAFLGHGHRESATRFVERYRAWCGRQAGRRAPVERAWRGSTRLCMVAPWSLYRALGAEHVRHRREGVASGGAAAAAAVARLRARKPDGAVAGDRGGEGRRADRGGRPRRGVAAPRLSGRVRLPPALLRAQAAARAGRGARDVRVRPGGGRDAERRPHVGRDARRLWTALCAAGLAVEVVVVGRDPERLAAAEPVLAGWTRAPAAPDGGAERSGEAARGAEAELAAVRAAVARGDLAAYLRGMHDHQRGFHEESGGERAGGVRPEAIRGVEAELKTVLREIGLLDAFSVDPWHASGARAAAGARRSGSPFPSGSRTACSSVLREVTCSPCHRPQKKSRSPGTPPPNE